MRKYSCTQTPSGAPSDLSGSRSPSAASPSVQRQLRTSASKKPVLKLASADRTTRLADVAPRPVEPLRRRSSGSADPRQPTLELHGLLTTEEAADWLHLSPWTLRHWVLDKRITCVRLGRLVRFRLADLEAFIDGRPNLRSKVA
jgi:excisionase family DNA binding protein